jgi:hypothetical protein
MKPHRQMPPCAFVGTGRKANSFAASSCLHPPSLPAVLSFTDLFEVFSLSCISSSFLYKSQLVYFAFLSLHTKQNTKTQRHKNKYKMATSVRTFIGFSLFLLCLAQVAFGQGIINNNPVPYGSCFNSTQDQLLLESETTTAQYVSVNVGVPFQTFFPFFLQGSLFPIWNPLFVNVSTQNLELCGPINAV